MKYKIIITPNYETKIEEFKGDTPLYDSVDGIVQECGIIYDVNGKNLLLYCNDSFKLREDLLFNIVGSILSGHEIHGNVLILYDGLNEKGELDALPFEYEEAIEIAKEIDNLAELLRRKAE